MPLALHILGGEMKRKANMLIGNAIIITHFFAREALRKHIQDEIDGNARFR